jgi:hypothetical protein
VKNLGALAGLGSSSPSAALLWMAGHTKRWEACLVVGLIPEWSVVRTRVRKLQVLESRSLGIATIAPWYIGNKQILEDLEVCSSPTTSEL